ncbi:MAG: nitroreductase family deazaflavin-dependent oxidoreductase [Chloroflexota bacterium]|nr:MAG: nitroreductase family deazaflavin-dependent oxidoreductase [Chloroflexota bacterium]
MPWTDPSRVAHAPRFVPLLNPLMRRLMGTGLPFGPNVLLTVRGRTSGRPRTFPVAVLETGGRRFVTSPYGQVNWVRNLRADGAATVSKGRERTEVEAVELSPEEGGAVLREAIAPYVTSRIGAKLVGLFYGLRPGASLEEYIEDVRGHPIFELCPRDLEAAMGPKH